VPFDDWTNSWSISVFDPRRIDFVLQQNRRNLIEVDSVAMSRFAKRHDPVCLVDGIAVLPSA